MWRERKSKAKIQAVLALSGSFAISFNLAIALHELGHAITYLINGGEITSFVLNPFSWSWAEGRGFSNRIFVLWDGATVGQLLVTGLLVILAEFIVFECRKIRFKTWD